MFKEYKKFIMTGNVIAVILVGIIGAVIKGFVSFIIIRIIGILIGGASFAEKFKELSPKEPPVLNDAD